MQLPHFRSRFHNKWGVGGLFVALIVRAQLLVSQQAGNLIVAPCAAVDKFRRQVRPPDTTTQERMPIIFLQTASVQVDSCGLFILTVCPGCNSGNAVPFRLKQKACYLLESINLSSTTCGGTDLSSSCLLDSGNKLRVLLLNSLYTGDEPINVGVLRRSSGARYG